MEIYKEEGEFSPVHITLETQEEVNVIFSIANFSPVTHAFDSQAACIKMRHLRDSLNKYKTLEYEKYHDLLNANIHRV